MHPDSVESPRMSCLITGGLGFIGSNLAIRLGKQRAAALTLIDSLNPKYGGNVHNLDRLAHKDKININISDVRDRYSLRHLLKDASLIYNLAGQTSHMDSMCDPFTDLDINSKAQLSLLEVCREIAPSVKIIFASTRQIYGRPNYLPVCEEHPLRPVDVNGINKLAGEQYHLLYSEVYGVRSTVLRLTNTYGPGMRIKDARQTFLGIWIRNLLLQKQFEVWDGPQLRDYTYVDDCIDALELAAEHNASTGQIYNLGGHGEPISLLETAEVLVKAAKRIGIPVLREPFLVKEFPADRKRIDIGDYYSDDRKIRDQLGWEPKISIEEGLARTLEYYRSRMEYYQ